MRTRGGGSSNVDRVRPTAYVRRKRGGHSNSVANEDFEENIEQKEVEIDDEGYSRGSVDKLLLIMWRDNYGMVR